MENDKLKLAQENYDAGKYNNTVAYCLQALNFKPENVNEIYLLLGKAYLHLGTLYTEWDLNDSIMACKYFKKILETDPNCTEAYLYHGIAILMWGTNIPYALEDFETVLKLEPDNKLASEYRQICYEQLKNL